MTKLVGRQHGDIRALFMQALHERPEHTIGPVVWVVGLTLRTMDDVFRLDHGITHLDRSLRLC